MRWPQPLRFLFKNKAFRLILCAALLLTILSCCLNMGDLFCRPFQPLMKGWTWVKDHCALKEHLLKKLKKVEEDNLILETELMFLQVYQDENKRLRALPPVMNHPSLISRVFSVNDDGRTAVIMSGSQNGLRAGDVVLNHQGVVGRIDAVGTCWSRLILVTHKNFRLPALGKKSQAQCIVSGADEDGLLLLYGQGLNPLAPHEEIVTSSYGGLCPKGYPIGRWVPEKDRIMPSLNTHQLDYVRVIIQDPLSLEPKVED